LGPASLDATQQLLIARPIIPRHNLARVSSGSAVRQAKLAVMWYDKVVRWKGLRMVVASCAGASRRAFREQRTTGGGHALIVDIYRAPL